MVYTNTVACMYRQYMCVYVYATCCTSISIVYVVKYLAIFILILLLWQIQLMGHSGSMGADYIQYTVGDRTILPSENQQYYSEKVIYLPHPCIITDHKAIYTPQPRTQAASQKRSQPSSKYTISNLNTNPSLDNTTTTTTTGPAPMRSVHSRPTSPEPQSLTLTSTITRESIGLSPTAFVLCNFNPIANINPTIFAVWMRILHRIPGSILWLLRSSQVEENLLKEASKYNINKSQLFFTNITSAHSEHIHRCALADLNLDATYYNTDMTVYDMLWAGTPPLTLPYHKWQTTPAPENAPTFSTASPLTLPQDKMHTTSYTTSPTASLLEAFDLTAELVCSSSLQQYEDMAVELAENKPKLTEIRRYINKVKHTCPAFDTHR